MTSRRYALRAAVRRALSATLVAPVPALTPGLALGQDDVAVLDRVEVTGSRIKRIDVEGPLPVTTISREEIDASGEISVAEVLRGAAYNNFGSWKPTSGFIAQSQAIVDLRGLGGERTLVLVDGRRVTQSPTYLGGVGTNLATLPLAAVERIEILRDGASAIYGSDAIGGVVNVILRRDYDGIHLSYGLGRPTQTGGDEDSYSIVGGITGGKGNITFSFENTRKEIIFRGDRSFSATSLSSFGFPGSYFGYLTTGDPRNPLGTFLSVGTFADPRCPSALGSSDFPDSVFADFGFGDGSGECAYNFARVAANEAEYDTKSFFLNANYAINESTTFFARGTFALNESFGRFAPTPFTSGEFLPAIFQDNPNNPTNPVENPVNVLGQPFPGQSVDLDGDGVADLDGPFDVSVLYRNVPGGFRDTFLDDTLVDYLAGVQGFANWLGGMEWELGAQYSQQTSDSRSPGLALGPEFEDRLTNGSLDIFAANSDTGDFARGLDPAFAASSEAVAATGLYDARTRIVSGDFTVNFDALQMEHGPVPVALGTEYRDEDFQGDFDEQTNAFALEGTAGGEDTSGARTVKAVFAETRIPLLAPLELSLAARWEDYNDFGTTLNPKIAASFRPLDSVLLRASWGTGFRAPSMADLYSSAVLNAAGAIDTTRCADDPAGDPETGRPRPGADLPFGNPCRTTQYQNFVGGNRDLQPEESTQWSVGIVFNPLDELSVGLDWYDIELEDEIGVPFMQELFDEEFRLRQAGETGNDVGAVTRSQNGQVRSVSRRSGNIAERETDGLDVEATYAFGLGAAGDFRATAQWNYVNEYEQDQGDSLGLRDPPFFDPPHRGTLGLNWALGDFSANLLWNYLASSSIEDGNGVETNSVDSYKTWDLSASYATPWNGQITLGARNLFDEDPPTTVDGFYTNYLHDVYGRVPYIRYEQDL
jgi:iron complex outermembrane receptor protein